MKRMVLLATAILAYSMAAQAGEITQPYVSVFGSATTNVTPDIMVWRLTVRNKGAELPDVAKAHTGLVQTVLDFLKQQEVPKETIQTSRMEFGENWEYRNRTRVREGYAASTNLSFKIHDLKKYKPLWIGLSRLSNVSMNGVHYDHSRRIHHRNETRKNALLAAREKAAALAKTLGSDIGAPLFIKEELGGNRSWEISNSNSNVVFTGNEGAGAGDAPLAPGKIPIQMRVSVAFRLVTQDK